MINKKDLLKELEEKFEDMKKDLNMSINLEDLDIVFSIKNGILAEGFVSDNLSRQICSKISETFYNWIGYLNNLILPNPGSMVSQTESKLFNSKEDKEMIWSLTEEAMKYVSKNSLDVIKKDKLLQKDLMEGALMFWKNEFSIKAGLIMERIHNSWNGK